MTMKGPASGPFHRVVSWRSVDSGAAAVRISDERCREREQTDCEHDERAMQ